MRKALSVVLGAFALSCGTALTAAEPDFLEPEQAFPLTVKAVDDTHLEVRVAIANGYYVYKNKLKLAADRGVILEKPDFPTPKIKTDAHFGEVETYRGELVLPVSHSASQNPFELTVTTQGCADAGLCYPPITRTVSVDGTGGTTASATPVGNAQVQASSAPAAADDESSQIGALLKGSNLPLILVSFFGFGLLLAFTPCVFPMIPILSGIIVGHGANITKKRALIMSCAYVLGMAVAYTLAGVAAGLSGTLLSSALQNAWVLGGFGLVFVALSFSMFGFYELQLPASLQSRLSDSANRQGGSLIGVTLMGTLSALIVGPCVAAPLAGALLYIAQTGDAVLGGLALFTMALGMGAPLIIVGVAARSALPKAGGWMEGVKKAFGVLLLGVAVWLVSPVVPPVVTMLVIAALLIFSGIFLHALDSLPAHASSWQRFWKGAGAMAVLMGSTMLVGTLAGSRDPLQPLAVLRAEAATTQRAREVTFKRIHNLAELDQVLKTADRPVMVDFYADWCVSCKEMEHQTFTDPAVRVRMNKTLIVQVDVTANSDDDKALLKRFGLFGPPGIVFLEGGEKSREVQRVIGFQSADKFAKVLDSVLTFKPS
jgi:thiol:disulfide interchange protein DsbD